jgi:Zn finger protein HypA/HybF involved in hydrogenase expression
MKGGASKGRQLYCLKCKTKVAAKNVTEMSKKTKIRTVKMAKGVCPKCGTKVFGIVGGGH